MTATLPAAGAIDQPRQTDLDPGAAMRAKHPPGLFLLSAVEAWERFSYYGMRALLVLYLVNALKWRAADASNLYGTYTALVYLTPLIGGWLADRFIGTRRSLVIGGLIIAAGHFALAFAPESAAGGGAAPIGGSMTAFYAGLLLVVIGTGFFKPNVSTMVGQLYAQGDAGRDAGFTIYYMCFNVGAAIAPLVCGYLGQSPRFGWHYGFSAAGVGMLVGLVLYVWGRDRYLPGVGLAPDRSARSATAARVGVTAGNVAEGALAQARAVEHAQASPVPGIVGAVVGAVGGYLAGGALGLAMGAVILWALATSVFGTRGEERNRVTAIFIVVFFVIFFWAAYEQAGSSMNLFADKNTNLAATGWMRALVGGDRIPSSWFQSVNPFILLVSGPLFAWLWTRLGRIGREPSTATKMGYGLALLGVGFAFMVLGAQRAAGGALVSPWWLVLAYAFHTWGELCLSPVGLSYVTKVAPARYASLMMGVWYLANSAANKVAGSLAAQVESWGSVKLYAILVGSSFAAAVCLFLLVPMLKRLTRSVTA